MIGSQLPAHLDVNGKRVMLKYHKLLSGTGRCPPNSLSALREMLDGGAAAIELDVRYLADDDFVLNHDATLDRETSHVGLIRRLRRADVGEVRLKGSDERLALLSEAVELLEAVDRPVKLQVDLKESMPLSPDDALRFLRAIEPLRANPRLRVIVGCAADWNLRAIRRLDDEIELGFDFLLYLEGTADSFTKLPTRQNVYGYVDDHPLGFHRLWPVGTYLRDRMEALLVLLPTAAEFYLSKDFVMQALRDGFNPVEFAHEFVPGSFVDVWTIDNGRVGSVDTMVAALEAGADQITTNTASSWPEALVGRITPSSSAASQA